MELTEEHRIPAQIGGIADLKSAFSVSKSIGPALAGVGVLVLFGWAVGKQPLVGFIPAILVPSPVSGVEFILCGLSLGCFSLPSVHRRTAWTFCGAILGVLAAIFGGLKFLDYILGLKFHVDQFLFAVRPGNTGGYPNGEMSANTALCFLLSGLGLVLFDVQTRRGFVPAQALALISGLIALLALIGYTYGVLGFYRTGAAPPMSITSAICFLALCAGIVAAGPRRGLVRVLDSATTGGAMARRLLPMAVLIPWVLGALLLLGEERGYFQRQFALAIFAALSLVVFTVLIWWNAKLLYRSDLGRIRAERRVAAQHNAARVLAEAASLTQALPQLLKVIGEPLGWPAGAVWVIDQRSAVVRCLETWRSDQAAGNGYLRASREMVFSKGEGLPGKVWAEAQPAWNTNLGVPNESCQAQLARKAASRGAVAVPIWVGQEVYGALEFFTDNFDKPDEPLLNMLSTVGSQLGLFIERTRAEEQLRQATANLQRSNTELQQFAYIASHDLFEPLRMVTSYLELLIHKYGENLDKTALEFVSFALDGARRMDALIHDLLAYSRVELRGRALEPTETEQVFQAAVANLKVAIEESGATISHEPLPTVRADYIQLTQVFQNLIGNAVKFHGPEPPRIHVEAHRRESDWIFSVRDNGIGIAPADFERIFVIFQRLHTRQEYAGTGMGLAICKKIIERHGGRIWVESVPGRGTTFLFTLPAEPGE